MALEVWRRVVTASRPCSFDSRTGMLELQACSLLGNGLPTSRLSCNVAGSPKLTLVSLSEAKPCSRIKSLFQENVEFTCTGGDVLVIGALLPRLQAAPSRGLKRKSAAVDAQASAAKRAAIEASTAKRAAIEAASTAKRAASTRATTASMYGAAVTPQHAHGAVSGASGNKKGEHSLLKAITHRVLNSGLAYDVLKVGSGAMAMRGKNASLRYEGRLAATGQSFDSGDIKFRLGMGEVIRAWDEGIQGMLVGELRRLYVPSRLGYGADGRPPAIPPGAGLIFEVELLSC